MSGCGTPASAPHTAPGGRKLLRLEVRNAATPIERKPEWIKTKARMGPEYQALQSLVKESVGDVPSVIAINKADLEEQWQLGQGDFDSLFGSGRRVLKTSAKTGVGVDEAFLWLAGETLKGGRG